MADKSDFTQVFEELKALFKPYIKKMDVSQDSESCFMVNTRHIMKNKQPLYFGGVTVKKSYVSFHLMSVYTCPELLKGVSPELKKRMQGKSCFNFKEVDKKLFNELKSLTRAGAAKFSDEKFVQGLRMMQG